MKMLFTVAAAAAVMAGSVYARTVAFWPLETDSSGAPSLRCAIAAENDFSCGDSSVISPIASAVTWNLPSAQVEDPARWIFPPLNRGAVKLSASGASASDMMGPMMADSPNVASLLDLRHDFTIEGWVKFTSLPANKEYVCLFSCGERNSDGTVSAGERGSWFISLRHTSLNASNAYVYDYQVYVPTYAGNVVLSPGVTSASTFTGAWHHLALVFRYEDEYSSGKSQLLFYTDGNLVTNVLTNARRTDTGSASGSRLYLGCRPDPSDSGVYLRCNASFDCWRVSDEALEPSQFLNAAAGTAVRERKANSTVAYWNLGLKEDGTIDLTDYAGDADLSLAFFNGGTNLYSHLLPSREKAFSGRPPNVSAATTASLPENSGSLCATDVGAYLAVPGFESQLDAGSSFTVEGWIKPGDLSSDGLVFGTAPTPEVMSGWALCLSDRGGGRFAFTISSAGSFAKRAFPDFAFGPETVSWMHVALVREGGVKWTLYVDGVSVGSVADGGAGVASDGYFRMFSCPGAPRSGQFFGNIDCVRIVPAAIMPKNFLNYTGADRYEPSGAIALWPMDPSASGLVVDGRDASSGGAHPITSGGTDLDVTLYAPAANPTFAAPVVTNPERLFAGNSAGASLGSGSVRWREGSPTTTARRSLLTRDSAVCDAISENKSFTLEMYLYRTINPQTWEALMSCFSPSYTLTSLGSSYVFNYTFRPSTAGNGIQVLDAAMGMNDTKVPSTTAAMIGNNVWHHLAITRNVTSGTGGRTNSTYTFYLNGVSKGTLTTNAVSKVVNPGIMTFGGKFDSVNSVGGRIGPIRLSNRVLATSEFLNATAEEPDPAPYLFDDRTIAYWPLEYADGALDVSNRTERLFLPTNSLAGVSGSDEGCCSRIPRPDTNIVSLIDTNVGSLAVAGGAYVAFPDLCAQMSLLSAFTVEGWVKWVDSGDSVNEAICGTYDEATADGWQLRINRNNGAAPRLEIMAKVSGKWKPVADAVFDKDVSAWNGRWRHVAVAYEPETDECLGTWTVYDNGVSCGVATNAFSVKCDSVAANSFMLSSPPSSAGAYRGISGNFDQWRVSRGALTPADFLYVTSGGFFLMYR